MQQDSTHNEQIAPFYTEIQAAEILGLPRWKIRRAVKQGIIPSYQLLNSRRLVRLRDVVDAMASSRQGER